VLTATAPVRVKNGVRRTWLLIVVISLTSPASADVNIRLTDGDRPIVVVEGVLASTLAALAKAQLDHAAWEQIFSLHVKDQTGQNLPAVLGDIQVAADKLTFTPRFPLKPGLTYRAVFDPGGAGNQLVRGQRIEAALTVPAPRNGEPTVVEGVFPSSNVLPENQLKFYIYFSAPMSRGESYRHLQLINASGTPVEAPFLELAEELWDDSGRRLTLLLDPGRVKRDLKPHKEVGRAIRNGQTYALQIANDWRDGRGQRLGDKYRKQFGVTAADVRQPDPKRWGLTLPRAGTRLPLVVMFDEPLDYAMLQHVIRVSNSQGDVLKGAVAVDKQETRWSFLPTVPWVEGRYRLLIDSNLEDLAGNSIARPFEVYLPAGRPAASDRCEIPFQIVGNSAGIDPPAKQD
jgi:hypothetical protein